MKRQAFTLIELLVVVAIISMLLAMLLPAFHEARSQARRTVCMTNMHSIGTAIYSYWTDWNSHVPYVWTPMTNGDFANKGKTDDEINPFDREKWSFSLANVLMPEYMAEQPGVFRCPEAVNGWPRRAGAKQYTYRPAAVNQPNGIPNAQGTYSRENFGFMDGRVLWKFRMDIKAEPTTPQDYINNAMEFAKSRATFLRDLIQMRANENEPVLGPHKGGILLLNRDLQVEFRSHKDVVDDLTPNYAGSIF